MKTWSTPVAAEQTRVIPCNLCGGTRFRPRLRCEGFSFVRCAACGLVQMNPQSDPGEVAKRYREHHGTDYLAYELANEASFLHLQHLALKDIEFERIEARLRAARKGAAPRLLDVGCATGALLATLSRRAWDCSGVELCTPSAEYARNVRGLRVFDQRLEEIHLADHSFDVVLASHLIEHLNDPCSFVQEVRRILAPGGYFMVTTPNIAGLQARLFGGRWRSAIYDHLYLFSVRTLRRLLRQEGFITEKTVTWGGLGTGSAPLRIKRVADRWAKQLGFGDVMILRARKPQSP